MERRSVALAAERPRTGKRSKAGKSNIQVDAPLRKGLRAFIGQDGGQGLVDVYDTERRLIALYATQSDADKARLALSKATFSLNDAPMKKSCSKLAKSAPLLDEKVNDTAAKETRVPRPTADRSAPVPVREGQGPCQNVKHRRRTPSPDRPCTATRSNNVISGMPDDLTDRPIFARIIVFVRMNVLQGQEAIQRTVDLRDILPHRINQTELERNAARRYMAGSSKPWRPEERADETFLRQLRHQNVADPYRRAAIYETEVALTRDRLNDEQYDQIMLALLSPDERSERGIGNTAHPHYSDLPHTYRETLIRQCGEWFVSSDEQEDDLSDDDFQGMSRKDYDAIFAEYAYPGHTEDEKRKRGYPTTEHEERLCFYQDLNPPADFSTDLLFAEREAGMLPEMLRAQSQDPEPMRIEPDPLTADRLQRHAEAALAAAETEEEDALLARYSKSEPEPMDTMETASITTDVINQTTLSRTPSAERTVRDSARISPPVVLDNLNSAQREMQMRYLALGTACRFPLDGSLIRS